MQIFDKMKRLIKYTIFTLIIIIATVIFFILTFLIDPLLSIIVGNRNLAKKFHNYITNLLNKYNI
jgi:hypothetical protein